MMDFLIDEAIACSDEAFSKIMEIIKPLLREPEYVATTGLKQGEWIRPVVDSTAIVIDENVKALPTRTGASSTERTAATTSANRAA